MSGGSKGDIVVTFLAAIVKVKDGAPVTILKGEPLPDNIAAGEVKRLAGLGAIGRRKAAEPAPDDAGSSTGSEGTTPDVPGAGFDIDGSDVPTLAKYLEEGKAGKAFTIPEVLAMAEVEGDEAATAARARHLLEAEQHRSGNDARDGITAGLAKLIEADPASSGS